MRIAAVVAQVAAVICLVIALRATPGGIEGAYFNRSTGPPTSVAAFTHDDREPWIIAAILLTASAATLGALALAAARRPRRGG